jgi:hypothetical protein
MFHMKQALFAFATIATLHAAEPGLTREQATQIIQTCTADKSRCPAALVKKDLFFFALVKGPRERVGELALEAAKKYERVKPDDITDEVLAPVVTFTVATYAPDDINERLHDIEHVFLRAKNAPKDQVVRPVREVQIPTQLQNGFGARATTMDMHASFRLEDIPTGDFDIVVLLSNTLAGEQTARVKAKEFARLQ